MPTRKPKSRLPKKLSASLAECVDQLKGWRRGKSMYPIDVAVAAVHHLEHAPAGTDDGKRSPTLLDTTDLLESWLEDETSELPETTALATLYWLQRAQEAGL